MREILISNFYVTAVARLSVILVKLISEGRLKGFSLAQTSNWIQG